jgi:hypothetical protein
LSKIQLDDESAEDYVALYSESCLEPRTTRRGRVDIKVNRIKKRDLHTALRARGQELQSDPCLIGISPNRTYRLALRSQDINDEFANIQLHLAGTQFRDSLSYFYTTEGQLSEAPVLVAVVDSGVNSDHPDLTENIYRDSEGRAGVDARTLGGPPEEVSYDSMDIDTVSSHGTHVSGLIAATGAKGCKNSSGQSLF